jgi:lipopolysaccharide export system permease protein
LLRVPLLFGLAVALLHAGLRAYVEPAGEQRLDALGASIAIGNLGLSIAPGEFLRPRPDTIFHVDAVDRRTGEFRGLFLRKPALTVAARNGRVTNGGRDGVLLRLADGHIIITKSGGRLEVASFRTMAMPVQLLAPKTVRGTARHRNDRLILGDLIAAAVDGRTGADRNAARAALGGRFASAAFIVLIPFFGFALGIPPKRSTSALGLGAGILLIVAFVQITVAIEDRANALAPLLQLMSFIGFALAALFMFRFQRSQGLGAIEAALLSVSRPARHLSRWMPIDRMMMQFPATHRPILSSS